MFVAKRSAWPSDGLIQAASVFVMMTRVVLHRTPPASLCVLLFIAEHTLTPVPLHCSFTFLFDTSCRTSSQTCFYWSLLVWSVEDSDAELVAIRVLGLLEAPVSKELEEAFSRC